MRLPSLQAKVRSSAVFLTLAILCATLIASAASADEQDLLDFCVDHPDRCAISVLAPDDGWERHLAPDRPQSLGSTVKIVSLLAYAEAVAAGKIDPDEMIDRDDWARYLTLDGGAFERTWNDLDQAKKLRLDDLVHKMIEHSDNATPDLLLELLGKKGLKKGFKPFGFHDLPAAISAQFGLWQGGNGKGGSGDRILDSYGGFDVKGYQKDLKKFFKGLRKQKGVRTNQESLCIQPPWVAGPPPCKRAAPLPGPDAFLELLRGYFTRSTTRSYAEALMGVLDGSLLSPEAQEVADRHLELWFELFPTLSDAYSRYGLKGGSLASGQGTDILTWANYFQVQGSGARYVVVVFLQNLVEGEERPDANDLNLFAQRIATNVNFRQTVRNTLDAEDERPELVPAILRTKVKKSGGETTITLRGRVYNAGPRASGKTITVSMALADGSDPDQQEVVDSVSVGSIKGYAKKNFNLSATVPGDASGSYVFLIADSDEDVAEQDERNNVTWER